MSHLEGTEIIVEPLSAALKTEKAHALASNISTANESTEILGSGSLTKKNTRPPS